MRTLFALLLLAGLGLAGWPLVSERVAASHFGAWRIYDDIGDFRVVRVVLPGETPISVAVEMTTVGEAVFPETGALLTLTATAGGQTLMAEALNFSDATPRTVSPQFNEAAYRLRVGSAQAPHEAEWSFTLGPGDAEGVTIKRVDLSLSQPLWRADPRLQPIGFAVAAIGFIGLVLAVARGSRLPRNPNEQPPAPRWGRGAGRPPA